jgi:ser/thr/tyr protein kinase RAD53
MEKSLQHPWLQSYTPVYDLHAASSTNSIDYSMMPGSVQADGSFPVNQDFRNMQIRPSGIGEVSSSALPGAFPKTSAVTDVQREDVKVAPLQRRSHVLSQAAEDGKVLTEPSMEMVAAATAQDHAASSSSKGQNKRVYSELTPLSEEASMDNDVGRSSPVSDAGSQAAGATHGKGRAVEPVKARNPRARAGDPNEANEDETVQPRRSGRHPKVARRG